MKVLHKRSRRGRKFCIAILAFKYPACPRSQIACTAETPYHRKGGRVYLTAKALGFNIPQLLLATG